LARFKVLQCRESGSWLHAIPSSPNIGTLLGNTSFQVCIGLRLSCNGLSRDDGKRPDGMTLVPWIKGQPLVWEVILQIHLQTVTF
jgi:hypothetical protein